MKNLFTVSIVLFSVVAFAHEGSEIMSVTPTNHPTALTCEEKLESSKAQSEDLAKKLKSYKYTCFAICRGRDSGWFVGIDTTIIQTHAEELDIAFNKLNVDCKSWATKRSLDYHWLDAKFYGESRSRGHYNLDPMNNCVRTQD